MDYWLNSSNAKSCDSVVDVEPIIYCSLHGSVEVHLNIHDCMYVWSAVLVVFELDSVLSPPFTRRGRYREAVYIKRSVWGFAPIPAAALSLRHG